ncbi:ADP-ribosylglycohydrolase family protein [Arenimonas alkanexedens]
MSGCSEEVLRDRLAGGLLGLLVGDALGVPYEFHPPGALPPGDKIEFTPPAGFQRSHVGVPPGTWSDDGAQALVLLDSLLANDGLDLRHFGEGIRRWLQEGRYAVGGMVFDIGSQTSSAINNLVKGVPAERSGPSEESRNGNGSLMRVLPLVLWHRGDEAELIQLASRQSLPTHGHARSRVACAVYCLWARAMINDVAEPWALAVHQLRTLSPPDLFSAQELELVLDPANANAAKGSGYVVDCLWSAKQAVEETTSYEACVKRAIAFGHDTDTTAAVAGGIAGLRYGLSGIPERWRDALRGENLYRPLLEQLLAHRLSL